MGRQSSIDQLPVALREKIGALRRGGCTIDQILAALDDLGARVSRSALARHVKQIEAVAEKMQRSRTIAEAVVDRFGEGIDSNASRVNIEMMHALLMGLLVNEEGGSITLEPQDAYFLSASLEKLGKARRYDQDAVLKEREEAARLAREDAARRAEQSAREQGLTAEKAALIRAQILGIKASHAAS